MTQDDAELRVRIKALLVQCARLKVAPSDIGDDQPLFDPEKGLGLDSIDVLEFVVHLERSFGVTIPDRETGQRVLRSVSTIAEFVRSNGRAP
ncbi:MAG TPA: acyl carrier protein [Planctomycetota bacterium]|jgi:acyl carrier protein|nr:acyl carrier protein [Planctomycetota bacterium]